MTRTLFNSFRLDLINNIQVGLLCKKRFVIKSLHTLNRCISWRWEAWFIIAGGRVMACNADCCDLCVKQGAEIRCVDLVMRLRSFRCSGFSRQIADLGTGTRDRWRSVHAVTGDAVESCQSAFCTTCRKLSVRSQILSCLVPLVTWRSSTKRRRLLGGFAS